MNRLMLTTVLLSALTVGISSAQESAQALRDSLAKNPSDIRSLHNLGMLYYHQATAGQAGAAEKGFDCFDKAVTIDPSDAVARAYRGSLWTLRGRDDSSMEEVDSGIDDMDKAVQMAPENLAIRLLRGINSTNLPSAFHRLDTALEDFNYLLALPSLEKLPVDLQSTIYCWAGIAYSYDNKIEKAKELLTKSVSVAPKSASGQRAEQELRDMK